MQKVELEKTEQGSYPKYQPALEGGRGSLERVQRKAKPNHLDSLICLELPLSLA